MNYLQEVEQKLRAEHLERGRVPQHGAPADAWKVWQDSVVRFVREAVLASYRNGQGRKSGGNGHTSALAAGKLKPVQ